MVHEIMFMSEGRTIPFVRVPGHDHAAIGYALDAGASLVIPQVETVAEAQHVVSSAKFGTASRGTRSAPPFRLIPGITDTSFDPSISIHENLNAQAAIMIQIETLQGIKNLDAILTEVKDIDAVWLGTLDARVSMNLPGNMGMGGNETEWLEAAALYDQVMARHSHIAKGGFALGPASQEMAKGKAFLVVAADVMAFGQLAMDCMTMRAAMPSLPVPAKKTANAVVSNGHAKEVQA